MSDELKRCPFCGWGAEKHFITKDCRTIDLGKVSCANPQCCLYDLDFTIDEWQSRPLEDDLITRRDELLDALEKIDNIGTNIPWDTNSISTLRNELMHCREIARAAIAKAKGERDE